MAPPLGMGHRSVVVPLKGECLVGPPAERIRASAAPASRLEAQPPRPT